MSKRGKAAVVDVRKWVNYAFSSGDHTNPYESADKRHALFAKELGRTLRMDEDFQEMSVVYGDTTEYVKRKYPHPGPVVPYDQLRYTPVHRFPGDNRI